MVQAIDDGWDAFDSRVAVYQGQADATTDATQKLNLLTLINALKSAKQAMVDKTYAEMDNATYAKMAALQAADATPELPTPAK